MSIASVSVYVKLEPVISREVTIAAIETYRASVWLREQTAKLIVATGSKSFTKWDNLTDESVGACRDRLLKAILAWSTSYAGHAALYTRHENRGVRYNGVAYLACYDSTNFDLEVGERAGKHDPKCMKLRVVKANTAKAMAKINAVVVDLDADVN